MKIVLGLGNPGARYASTRHNLGFRVVDLLAERAGANFVVADDAGGKAWTTQVVFSGRTAVLAKPRTYMNRSGRAALALCRYHEVDPREMLVVYDDADLQLGRIRLRTRGRAAGHRGVRSLIDALGGDEFPRIKLGVRGVGRDERELADYVLDDFEDEERPLVERLVTAGADAVEAVFATGMEAAMNRFNAGAVSGEATTD